MREISLDLSSFKMQLDKARDAYWTGSGRIAQLSLFTDYARIVFDTHRGRTDYLRDYTTDEIRGYTDVFP